MAAAAEVLEVSVKLDTGEIRQGFIAIEGQAQNTAKKIGGAFDESAGRSRFAPQLVRQFDEIGQAAESGFTGIARSFIEKAANPMTLAIAGVGAAFVGAFAAAKAGEEEAAIGRRFEVLAQQAGLLPERLTAGLDQAIDGLADLEDVLKVASEGVLDLGANASRLPEIFELAKQSSKVLGGDLVTNFDKLSNAIANGNARQLKNLGITIDANKALREHAAALGVVVDQLTPFGRQTAILNETLKVGTKQLSTLKDDSTPIANGLQRMSVAMGNLKDAVTALANSRLGGFFADLTEGVARAITTVGLSFDKLSGAPTTLAQDVSKVRAEIARLNEMKLLNPNLAGEYQKQIDPLLAKLSSLQQVQTAVASAGDKALSPRPGAEGQIDQAKRSAKAWEEYRKEIQLAEDQYTEFMRNEGTWANFARGFEEQTAGMVRSVRELGAQLKTSIAGGMASSLAALGKSLAQGGMAFHDFAMAALGALGAVCIQMGTALMLAGLGWSVIPGFQQSFGAVAAGAALVVLGGVLQGLAGASGGGGGAPATAGGGVAADPGSSATALPDKEREKPQTVVQVNVQGDILDSQDTERRIFQMIRDKYGRDGETLPEGLLA